MSGRASLSTAERALLEDLKPSARQAALTIIDCGPSGAHSFQLRDPEYGGHIDAPKRVSEANAAAKELGYDDPPLIEATPEKWSGHNGKRYRWRGLIEGGEGSAAEAAPVPQAPVTDRPAAGESGPSLGESDHGGDGELDSRRPAKAVGGESSSAGSSPAPSADPDLEQMIEDAPQLPDGHLFDLEDFKQKPGHDREAA